MSLGNWKRRSPSGEILNEDNSSLLSLLEDNAFHISLSEETAHRQRLNGESSTLRILNEESSTLRILNEESSTRRNAGEESSTRRNSGEESSTRRNAGEESSTRRNAGEESSTRRSLYDEIPVRRSLNERNALRRSLNEERPIRRSLSEERLIRRSLSEERLIRRKLYEDRPIRRSLYEERLIRRNLDEDRPDRRYLNEERHIRRNLSEDRPDRRHLDEERSIRRNSGEESPTRRNLSEKITIRLNPSEEIAIRQHLNEENAKLQSTTSTRGIFTTREDFMGLKLPKRLQAMFTLWGCRLCNCMFNSPFISKDHYTGKRHTANIKKWLSQRGHATAEDRADSGAAGRVGKAVSYYCQTCAKAFMSKQSAEEHFFQTGHQIACLKPLEITPKSSRKSNRLTSKTSSTNRKSTKKTSTRRRSGAAAERKEHPKDIAINKRHYCKLCKISCVSEITLNQHLNGAKHKKKLASLPRASCCCSGRNQEPRAPARALISTTQQLISTPRPIISTPRLHDVFDYKTPSGRYYCRFCDVVVLSVQNFMQHLDSKTHQQKTLSSIR